MYIYQPAQLYIFEKMGAQIPKYIKAKVLGEWLQGFPRDYIAEINHISAGAVTNIIQQSKKTIPDVDLLRGLASQLRKDQLDIGDFADSVRLQNTLNRLGLPTEKVETFLGEINIHCFRRQIEEKEFVFMVDELSGVLKELDMDVYNLQGHIENKQKQSEILEKRIQEQESHLEQKVKEYNVSINELERYQKAKPLLDKMDELENRIESKDHQISKLKEDILELKADKILSDHGDWVSEIELDEASKKLPKDHPLDAKELNGIRKEIFHNPSKYVDVIKTVRYRMLKEQL
ncbi:MAG: hypothetical protein M3162_01255 [Thermoproteota archaeon]|nr:hypothetical protein [Thermoproteota archaeon]